jgi:hypothetical protein
LVLRLHSSLCAGTGRASSYTRTSVGLRSTGVTRHV